jgi:predicted nucleic acid-binding Zn ribbon protein
MEAAGCRVEGVAMKQTKINGHEEWTQEEQQKRRRIARVLFLLAVLSLVVFIVFRILLNRIS